MKHRPSNHIFIVDDKPKILEALTETLKQIPCQVFSFTNAESCIKQLVGSKCHLLITDVNMPGMDGLELLTIVKHMRPLLPVVIITGYGDVRKAVEAIKTGAHDFIEKPFDENHILELVKKILRDTVENDLSGRGLTKCEIEVLKLVVQGKSNKEIASLLSRSNKTIEFHRYRLMKKLGAHNLADLLRTASDMNF